MFPSPSDKRRCKCDICELGFIQSSDLKNTKKFTMAKNLNKHVPSQLFSKKRYII